MAARSKRMFLRTISIPLALTLVAFWVLSPAIVAQEGESLPRYLVDVFFSDPKDIQRLAEEDFDIAGVDRTQKTVGIVAEDKDLWHLSELGFTYSIRDYRETPKSPDALSDYTDPAEMEAFLLQVVAAHPTLAQLIVLQNQLYEGSRKLYAIKITANVSQPNDRPAFLMDGQHHAREVMCSEISRDMIDYLTDGYAGDPQVQAWLDNINVYVVPQVNPDGINYVFTVDSWWRKNRHACSGGTGIDVNRNYGFAWNACGGSSGSCTSDTYRGTAGDSELETQGLQQIMADTHAFFGLSYHSYGEYIIHQYGCSGLTPDEAVVIPTAQALNAVLPDDSGVTGQYTVGTPLQTVGYSVDGGSSDNQYAKYGTYSFVIEVNTTGFQPDYATYRNVTVQRQRNAWQFFLNRIMTAPQIRGKVTDASTGLPLAAQVSLQEVTFTHGELPRHADNRGIYHWLVNPGTYHLTFTMPGYCTRTETVTVGSSPLILNVQLGQPSAPGGLSAVANGDNRIDLSWGASTGVTEYRILRSLTAGGPYTQIGTAPAPATTYSDTAASGNVPLFYVVRAFQGCESQNSNEASAQTTGSCLLPPSFAGLTSVVNAENATCSLVLAWGAAAPYCAGPVTYRVYRSSTSPFTPSPANLVAAGLGGTTYTDRAVLSNGTTVYYVVRSADAESGAEDANAVTKSGVPTGPVTTGSINDTFEAAGGFDTPGWTHAIVSGSTDWAWSTAQAQSGTHSWFASDVGSVSDKVLVSPEFGVLPGTTLSFFHRYAFENTTTCYDGGTLEYAVAPYTSWTVIPDACFTANGFNGTVSTGYSNPIGGKRAWCFSLGSWTQVMLNLGTLSGQTIKVRWHEGDDSGVAGTGWYVDSVLIQNAGTASACSSGAVPNPKEASPPGSPMRCAKTAAGSAVEVTYAPGCGALGNSVFMGGGPVSGALNWTRVFCALGNTGKGAFDPGDPPPGGWFYFVVVGQNATRESSYGRSSAGVERPQAVGLGSCDLPQDLSGVCP